MSALVLSTLRKSSRGGATAFLPPIASFGMCTVSTLIVAFTSGRGARGADDGRRAGAAGASARTVAFTSEGAGRLGASTAGRGAGVGFGAGGL